MLKRNDEMFIIVVIISSNHYWLKPHLRPDKDFQTCLHQICPRAEQALLQIMIHQQEKTTGSDTKALTDLKETLATMFPDKNKPNGGSTMLPADPLSESTSPNHLPDTSRMQLTNLLY